MSELPPTEQRNVRSMRLASMTPSEVVGLMDEEEHETLEAVRAAAADLAAVAEQVATAVTSQHRVVLLGAGTSGRIAAQEVAELRPTFGIDEGTFWVFVAGGPVLDDQVIAVSEDDEEAAPRALQVASIGAGDVVIGVAASGSTPFVLAGVRAAADAGAWTCAIANNAGAPLLDACDCPVLLNTGPEVLTGSTRLKAATAQKLALNRITVAAMVASGRVVENHMVDLVVSVAKLQERAVRIVRDLADVDDARARALLVEADWNVRRALNVGD